MDKAEKTAEMINNLPGMITRGLNDPPNFTLTFASEGCKALTGYTPEELTGTDGLKFLDIVHPEDAQALEKLHGVTLSVGMPLETTVRIITKDGEEKWTWLRSRIVDTDSKGMPYIIEGFYTDITNLMNTETTKLVNHAKSHFFEMMGNEIRTAANAVLGMAELGLREDMPVKVREYTHIIKEAGEKLVAVLNSILDYAKIESNEIKIHTEKYALNYFVNDMIDTVSAQISGKNLKFKVHVDSKIPNVLVGDAVRLRQVLLNILSNAVKFTDKGYVSLSIDGEELDGTANLTITISDTGRGIKEENLKNVFKEFTQFDIKTIEGLGLGLVIADNLVKLMGGEIHVSSVYGVGSIFVITLPQIIHSSERICAVTNPDDKHVLIFETRESCKDSITQTLDNLGVDFEVVSTTSEFYSALISGRYPFAFAANKLYGEFKKEYPDFKSDAKIVLITEFGEAAEENDYAGILTMPIFCLPVADILNDVDRSRQGSNKINFTAPDARVLIVDDISANLAVAEGLLQPYKMHLDTCIGGAEAIEAVKSNNYDLILMDHMMPVMNGVEAALCIRGLDDNCRTDCKNVPIVVLTANAMYASREAIRQNGFDDYLPKPIEMVKLHDIIEKWIPRAKQRKLSEPIASEAAAAPEPNFEIAGIDVKKGIAMTGGSLDTYLQVIKTYYENSRSLLRELRDRTEQGTTELYGIHVHALKSASGSIGAANVSKAAGELEFAADQGDMAFIQDNNPKFLEELERLLDNIYLVLFKDTDNQDVNTDMLKSEIPSAERRKILLIDDSDSFILILNNILKDDYETLISLDGEDGLETARLTMPDLILLDIVMPGLSGYDVLKALKADKALKSIPVILISGKDSDTSKAKGYTLGAADYIKKPFETDIVKDKVDSIMRSVSMKDKLI
ncbi:MAG: response regulator [Defluviitaleaceae bacterium]|nr:response regulator [Defluviitaleaceae bacterium]